MKQFLKQKYLFVALSITCIFNTCVFSFLHSTEQKQQVKSSNIWCNDELCITFYGGYEYSKDLPRIESANYFDQIEGMVKYCKVEPQPEYVQQVSSDDGWLCNLYILPTLNGYNISNEIKNHFEVKNGVFKLTSITKLSINNMEVLKWRYQMGKTRLDHFLVSCKKHNYLFVSSPYGDNGEINELINSMSFIK